MDGHLVSFGANVGGCNVYEVPWQYFTYSIHGERDEGDATQSTAKFQIWQLDALHISKRRLVSHLKVNILLCKVQMMEKHQQFKIIPYLCGATVKCICYIPGRSVCWLTHCMSTLISSLLIMKVPDFLWHIDWVDAILICSLHSIWISLELKLCKHFLVRKGLCDRRSIRYKAGGALMPSYHSISFWECKYCKLE